MTMLNLDVFPEIIAAVALCPIGFALTFIIHYTAIEVTIIPGTYDLIWGPYVAIIASAIIACIVMQTMKLVHHNYKFEHFYLILVGLVLTTIAGIAMFLYDEHRESRIVLYVTASGIGFVYVPALAYIHARAKDYRHIKISLCHLFYFIGFVLGSVIMSQYEPIERLNMLKVYGYILTAISVVIIILVITNEILQLRYKTYFNYKQCTEYNMDYENKFKTIFLKSYFKNAAQNADINLNNYKRNPFKLVGYFFYIILIKLISIVYLYYPLLFLNAIFISGTDLFYCYLISLIGLVASTILLNFIKIKTNFLVSLILKIISFLLLILFTNIYDVGEDGLMIFYWIHAIFLLYGYNVNDILVLELTKLKYTELLLTIGLVLEILVNGILHYFMITSPSSILNMDLSILAAISLARPVLEHIIPIIIVLILVLFITILVLPETSNKSVLQIQNIMFFKIYDKIGNGSAVSIIQKESEEYDTLPPPAYGQSVNMENDDRKQHPSSRFTPQHMQTVSMSSSTATAEFNYRPNQYQDGLHSLKPAIPQRPLTPPEPSFDYTQIKPKQLFPRPRPTSNNFDPYRN